MRALLALVIGLIVGRAGADTIPITMPYIVPMTSGGVQSGSRVYSGVVTTTTGGAWSVDLTGMSCTTTPVISAQAVSSDGTLANSASATTTAVSNTASSGFVNLPNTIAVGGSPVQRGAAGLSVHVIAVCR